MAAATRHEWTAAPIIGGSAKAGPSRQIRDPADNRRIIGTVVGMFIPTVLQNGFIVTDVEPFWQEVAIGLILIAAVYLDQLKRWRRERG